MGKESRKEGPGTKKVIIIGGGAAGMATATRIRRHSPHAITVLSMEAHTAYSHCGIPFVFSREIESFDRLVVKPPEFFRKNMIEVQLNTEALAIDPRAKIVRTRNRNLAFDKLVIATGSEPFVPGLKTAKNILPYGIYTLRSLEDGIRIEKALEKAKSICIVGAGTIGIECATATAKRGIRTTIISRSAFLLSRQLDPDMAAVIQEYLESLGILVLTEKEVLFPEKFWEEKAVIAGKERIQADLVLLASGAVPKNTLARNAGISIGTSGGIIVNEYLQVKAGENFLPDVYAGGECAEIRDFITGEAKISQLGSTARRMADVIADNVCGEQSTFGPLVNPWVASAGELQFGGVGITEKEAKRHGMPVITGYSTGYTRASYYPGRKKLFIKLHFLEGCLAGAQVIGGEGVKERIDALALAIRNRTRIEELLKMETSYAPPVSMLVDPLHPAVKAAFKKMQGEIE